jgi:hypothetical protein
MHSFQKWAEMSGYEVLVNEKRFSWPDHKKPFLSYKMVYTRRCFA